jgi:hypothetical protein
MPAVKEARHSSPPMPSLKLPLYAVHAIIQPSGGKNRNGDETDAVL